MLRKMFKENAQHIWWTLPRDCRFFTASLLPIVTIIQVESRDKSSHDSVLVAITVLFTAEIQYSNQCNIRRTQSCNNIYENTFNIHVTYTNMHSNMMSVRSTHIDDFSQRCPHNILVLTLRTSSILFGSASSALSQKTRIWILLYIYMYY